MTCSRAGGGQGQSEGLRETPAPGKPLRLPLPGSLIPPVHRPDRHLAQNPFICDCNLKWLADFLRTNPVETSGARCASPRRLANKRIGQIKSKKFRCSGSAAARPLHPQASPHCRGYPPALGLGWVVFQSCPGGD